MKDSPTVTKAEAAALLGCTTKSVERYAAAGKLTKFENRGPRRNEVHYLESDVVKLRDEQASATPAPRIVRETDRDRQPVEALQRREFFAPMLEVIAEQRALAQQQVETVGRLFELARQTKTDNTVSVSDKPLLMLDECRQLTGLSRNHLLEAIHAGKLKAKIIGRAWRIKRSDLDAYLKKL